MKNCKLCSEPTDVVFNIDFKATPICEGCASTIFMQQANWYANRIELKPLVSQRFNTQTTCPACNEKHKNWHILPDKYKCTTCGYVFTVEKGIIEPSPKIVQTNTLFCPTCDKQYSDWHVLAGNVHECIYCKYQWHGLLPLK